VNFVRDEKTGKIYFGDIFHEKFVFKRKSEIYTGRNQTLSEMEFFFG